MGLIFRLTSIFVFIIFFFSPFFAHAHIDVWLKNEMGDRISPQSNSIDPYSPRQTCGGCHDYRLITSGYHFTQGFETISDRFDPQRPWLLSPGMFGRWLPTAAAGRISPKVNKDPKTMDLSTYDWIGRGGRYSRDGKLIASACGFCHPGGGPMEYGRNRQGRPDFSKNLMAGEKDSSHPFDGDYSSLDTPTGKSLFQISGVVEADCLICHLKNYDMRERNIQLSKRNYRWAATAGARLGTIEGEIFTPHLKTADPSDPAFYQGTWNVERRPVVRYRWSDRNLFTPEGRLKGSAISRIVSTKNCLQCHDLGEKKNTGTMMSPNHDVHLSRGFICTDCHPLLGNTKSERLAHQIAKGHSLTNRVRDDLDGKEMKTCEFCHVEGKYKPGRAGLPTKAPNPYHTHSRAFRGYQFHTYLLNCMVCHASTRPGRALLLLDMSQGYEAAYVADNLERVKEEGDYLLPAPQIWSPWMFRSTRYEPVVPKWLFWFAQEEKGHYYPIPLRYVKAATKGIKIERERPFIAKENDMWLIFSRLKKAGFDKPALIAHDRAYILSGNKVEVRKDAVPKVYYPVVHGVQEKKTALKGCLSCHGSVAPFFRRMEIVNLRDFLLFDYPTMREPNCVPQFKIWGLQSIPAEQ
ncbi:MAG: hypothetical protein N2572_05235 [Syntrophales bacterium]|nr:hypothetical protein [Syntrophales bacterium]